MKNTLLSEGNNEAAYALGNMKVTVIELLDRIESKGGFGRAGNIQ